MFGLPVEVPTLKGQLIQLRPIPKTEAATLARGFSKYPVVRTLTSTAAATVEREEVWIEDASNDKEVIIWGIYRSGELIGATGLHKLRDRRATSGCCIFRDDLWGDGVIRAVHHARMFYAVRVLGLEAVDSHVLRGNTASRRALERVGYVTYGMHFSDMPTDGSVGHTDVLLWVNPQDYRWTSFWGGQPIPRAYAKRFEAGRERAEIALGWAESNVTWL